MSVPLRSMRAASRLFARPAIAPCACLPSPALAVRYKHSKKQNRPVGSRTIRATPGEVDLSNYEAEKRPGETFDIKDMQYTMNSAVDKFRQDLKPLVSRISELSPAMLDRIRVKTESKDPPTVALQHIATVEAVKGGLEIRAFEQSTVKAIEAALSRDGLNASVTGATTLRLAAPKPDVALRQRLAQDAANAAEKAHSIVRTARQKAQKQIDGDKKSKIITADEADEEKKDVDAVLRLRAQDIDTIKKQAEDVILDK